MFSNIGGKIKKVAKVFCWIGIVISVLFALVMFIGASEVTIEKGLYILLCFAVLILCSILSWIGSMLLYGFGELIDTNKEIAENTKAK